MNDNFSNSVTAASGTARNKKKRVNKMSTKVVDLSDLSGWLDVEGKCNGEFVDNIWGDEYAYCQIVDITIENLKYFGITKPTLVIYFKKDEKEGDKEHER